MAEQVRRGDDVSYFFSGRYYPYLHGPRLRRWERDGVVMLEVVNSPLHDHGRQPGLELSEPAIEQMLERTIETIRPDVVHIQELAGLPGSLIDISRNARVTTIMTLHDYFPLCPTFKLLDSEGQVCLRKEVGADCVATVANSPSHPDLLFTATLAHDLPRLPLVRLLPAKLRDRPALGVAGLIARRATRATRPPAENPAVAYQRRRDLYVARLNEADSLIAVSKRVAEIYEQLGVRADLLQTMQITLRHFEDLHPRTPDLKPPLTFGTLAGLESQAKGAHILIDAMRALERAVGSGRLRLVVFGYVPPGIADQARQIPGIELRGPYLPQDMDQMLDAVDVGILPSVWEEAYGFTGIEFLAKGIPVIANRIGGMVDYTREGETGWLNHSCSSQELAGIMGRIADDPEQVSRLNSYLKAQRDSIIMPMARHANQLDGVYAQVGRSVAI